MEISKEFVGLLATSLTVIMDIPQIYKIYKYKSVDGISFISLLMKFLMLGIWAWYGVMMMNVPLILTNFISLIWAVLLIVGFLKWRKNG